MIRIEKETECGACGSHAICSTKSTQDEIDHLVRLGFQPKYYCRYCVASEFRSKDGVAAMFNQLEKELKAYINKTLTETKKGF